MSDATAAMTVVVLKSGRYVQGARQAMTENEAEEARQQMHDVFQSHKPGDGGCFCLDTSDGWCSIMMDQVELVKLVFLGSRETWRTGLDRE